MTILSRFEPAPGRKRVWTAHNGQKVVLPILATLWETDPDTGEHIWIITSRIDISGSPRLRPRSIYMTFDAPDGVIDLLTQRGLRWSAGADAVADWMPELLAEGRDPFTETPPEDWWTTQRRELTDGFLQEIAAEYLRLGRGYAPVIAARYSTSVRTVRSWVDKARERGFLGPSLGHGRVGEAPSPGSLEGD